MLLNIRMLRRLDIFLVIIVILLAAFGLLSIYSAAAGRASLQGYPVKQALWVGIGFLFMIAAAAVDYRSLARLHRQIYWVNLLLLLAVLVIGQNVKGAQRWIPLGPFALQPSELCKLAVIITLAVFLADSGGAEETPTFLGSLRHVALPMLLIAVQPDLGTALTLGAIFAGMLFVAGARRRHLLSTAAVLAAVFPLVWRFGLRTYQKQRLTSFLDPGADPLGTSYQLNQSRIAIGSGRWLGQGFLKGSQKQLSFIPEQHTDFIFSVIGEEGGFIGGLALLLLFAALFWRGLRIMMDNDDALAVYICAGILSMTAFHLLVNLGMTVGIMPTTGIPLPFISYGGSSMLVNMIAVGLLLGIGMRRHKILFS